MMQNTKEVKVVMLGDSGVGKTCLVHRFVKGNYDEGTQTTVGANFFQKVCQVEGHKIQFQIWDTAGQEKYHSLAPIYYKGSHIAIVVYDVTNRDSFSVIQSWVSELKEQAGEDIIIAIVGNKIDLDQDQQVPYQDASAYADSVQGIIKLTSAKKDQGVEDLFEVLGQQIIKRTTQQDKQNRERGDTLSVPSQGKKRCC